MRSAWYLPVGVSLVLLGSTGLCLYAYSRLEMSRDGAAGVTVLGVAAQLLMMCLWVWIAHV